MNNKVWCLLNGAGEIVEQGSSGFTVRFERDGRVWNANYTTTGNLVWLDRISDERMLYTEKPTLYSTAPKVEDYYQDMFDGEIDDPIRVFMKDDDGVEDEGVAGMFSQEDDNFIHMMVYDFERNIFTHHTYSKRMADGSPKIRIVKITPEETKTGLKDGDKFTVSVGGKIKLYTYQGEDTAFIRVLHGPIQTHVVKPLNGEYELEQYHDVQPGDMVRIVLLNGDLRVGLVVYGTSLTSIQIASYGVDYHPKHTINRKQIKTLEHLVVKSV